MPIIDSIIAGYISNKRLLSGFMVGILSACLIMIFQQFSAANPLRQKFTPSILFDEVFIKSCIAALSGATGELIAYKRNAGN